MTSNKVSLPFRKDLAEVEPYGAPQLDVPVRLNVNENPYAPTPEVVDSVALAVRDVMSRLNRYADRDATGLRQGLAAYLARESGVTIPADRIWAANGSNEIMLQLLQALGGPGRTAMGAAPTYSMYHEYARDAFTNWVCLPAAEVPGKLFPPQDTRAITRGLTTHHPVVFFLPSPNNPTGMPTQQSAIEEILDCACSSGPDGNATIVVVDEAYGEFRTPGSPSALELLDLFPHLVVTRTMSKAFAAAGLRLGYMAASPEIVYEVQKVRLPYHLSLITQAAALAALEHAESQLQQVAEIREERDKLAAWLRDEGFEVAESASNFLLFGPVASRQDVWQRLVDRGVLIRVVGPEGCLRVTVGTPAENDRFRHALREVTR